MRLSDETIQFICDVAEPAGKQSFLVSVTEPSFYCNELQKWFSDLEKALCKKGTACFADMKEDFCGLQGVMVIQESITGDSGLFREFIFSVDDVSDSLLATKLFRRMKPVFYIEPLVFEHERRDENGRKHKFEVKVPGRRHFVFEKIT